MQAVGNLNPTSNGESQSSSRSMGSRKRKGGISPPTTLELRGISIHFPFRPYKCQEAYMEKVLEALQLSENALLESPTGTGKTLCLLCATLAWQRQQARASVEDPDLDLLSKPSPPVKRVPTIIYASRTHSQLSQVVRELRSTRYRPRHAVLGSREQMCVNPKVKKPTSTGSDINHDCNALSKERKCRFRNQLDGFNAPNHSNDGAQAVLDMEDLISMGQKHHVCPFYYTRSMVADAELVLMPYNYLFDKDARETTLLDVAWEGAIVIFDEAHNLESFATESASFDLNQADLAVCVAELDRALTYIQMTGDEDSHAVKRENVIKLKALFLMFEGYLTSINNSGAFAGEYMMELFTKGMTITYTNHHLFVDEVKKVSELLMDVRGGGSSKKGAPKLEHFVQCIKRVFGENTEARCLAKAKSYRVHLSPKGGPPQPQNSHSKSNPKLQAAAASRTLSYWCFAPSLAMQELTNLKLRSILVTSGTLSPLPSYSLELGLPFPHTLENPHIISDDQIHVRVIGRGVSGKELTSSFQRRKDADYYSELGNTLVSLAKVIPAGMLVFFPSYSVMETCLERWGGPISSTSRFHNNKNKTNSFFAARNNKGKNAANRQQYSFPFAAPSIYGPSLGANTNPLTPWKRLLGVKSVVIEPRSTSDLPDAISEFHKYLAMPKTKGVALFGICRGKISEGIDFAGDQSRAVVITGLPFPPAFDPRVKLKREYLDSAKASKSLKSTEEGGFGDSFSLAGNTMHEAMAGAQLTSLSGAAWYNQQAHRACNQAIGRVIRNKDDYGAVLLLDSRYAQPANQQGLSKWVRSRVQKDQGVGAAISALAKFYRQAEAQAKEREETNKGIMLEFEQENEMESKKQKEALHASADETFTKVAFVQNLTRDLKQPNVLANDADTPEIDEGKEETVSYIAPERVLARLDVDKVVQERKKESVFEMESSSAKERQPKSNGQESVFASFEGRRLPMSLKKPSSADHMHAIKSSSQSSSSTLTQDPKKAAVLFFKKAQRLLRDDEFASLRKNIVAMKQHGDKNEIRLYLTAATAVVNVCCERELFFGQYEQGHGETMLFLFFQLLPRAHRKMVEQMAMVVLLRRSTFGYLLKENLEKEDLRKVKAECSALLQRVWCDWSSLSGTEQKAEFLQHAQKVLSLLHDTNKTESSRLFSWFAKLLPSRFSSPLKALIAEDEASRNIQRMKTTEAQNKGEDSIELFRFQRILPSQTPGNDPFATQKTTFQSSKKFEPFVMRKEAPKAPAQLASLQKRETTTACAVPPLFVQREPNSCSTSSLHEHGTEDMKSVASSNSQSMGSVAPGKVAKAANPYAKKPKSLSAYISKQPVNQAAEVSRTAQFQQMLQNKPQGNQAPPAYSRKSELAVVGKPLPSFHADAVSDMLDQAESKPFVRKTSADIVQSLQSNVPSNVCCIVCSKTAETPMLSDCGHMACKDCWLQWLQRSKTCPVCRVEVEAKSLAKVVFQDHYQETAPTFSLTQLGD